MSNLIALIVFIVSLIVVGVIIYKKMLILKELPELAEKSKSTENKTLFLFNALLRSCSARVFEKYLQKILSKIRVLSLRIDSKTFNWLQKLRKRSQEKENEK